jgi:hypothetical protein
MKKFLQSFRQSIWPIESPAISAATSPIRSLIDDSHLLPNGELMRMGTPYGGWNIPRNLPLGPESICYLAGAGEDISFDCALVERFGCAIRILDPTPRAIQHFEALQTAVNSGSKFAINSSESQFYQLSVQALERMRFLPYGLGDADVELKFYYPRDPTHVSCSVVNLQKTEDYFTGQCYGLSTLMDMQQDMRLDLLKMNIEGAEYAAIADLLQSKIAPSTLLIVFDEGHTPMDDGAHLRIRTCIGELHAAGYRCIAIEGCNASFVLT